jgi:multisubunit Na+/H+ antiporter MnhB subunit
MALVLCLIFYIHSVNENSGNLITEAEIQKLVTVGWVVIGLLLSLFVANIVTGIAIEW